jgi:hypothetical protein
VLTDVKHLRGPTSIASAVKRGKKQGPWVILDGTTVGLTLEQARVGLTEFEEIATKHPGPVANLSKVLIVLGNSAELVEHDRGPSRRGIVHWLHGTKVEL